MIAQDAVLVSFSLAVIFVLARQTVFGCCVGTVIRAGRFTDFAFVGPCTIRFLLCLDRTFGGHGLSFGGYRERRGIPYHEAARS